VTDTIFALASGRPPAAVAILRVSGPQAHAAGAKLAGELPPARQAGVRTLRAPDGSTLDDALVLRFDSPASFTGQDSVEFQCHGGRAVVDAVHAALAGIDGLREALPGEFTRRAFENGRIDLTEAEGLADLIEAETESQRRTALAMAEGGLRRQIDRWRQQLLALSARAEAAIDYAEEGDVGGDPALAADCAALAAELGDWLARPRVEPLKDGVRVVVAGPPNAGKSSLLNAIAGSERAIVTPLPGTTRDHIEVPLAVGGIPILLTDTAGLRESADTVERIGVDRARALVAGADVLL
jgi:tRNA modification GTPase